VVLSKPLERMVANELVDLAWVEEGENWKDETLDGKVCHYMTQPLVELYGGCMVVLKVP
jgi:hypothetical protein